MLSNSNVRLILNFIWKPKRVNFVPAMFDYKPPLKQKRVTIAHHKLVMPRNRDFTNHTKKKEKKEKILRESNV